MPTVKVDDLISKTQVLLQDESGVRWPPSELLGWLNDGYRELVFLVPSIGAKRGNFTCALGTRQDITTGFPQAVGVVDVIRCLSAESNRGSIKTISKKTLDSQIPGWHTEDASYDVELFIPYGPLEREFFVYPPAVSGAQLELVYAQVPDQHVAYDGTTVINVGDQYANALIDYMLYRAYSKESDEVNAALATAHFAAMRASLGLGGS